MSSYTDNLRDQSKEMREHVKSLLDKLRARPSFLKERLAELSLVEGVPEQVKQSLLSLAEEFGSDGELYLFLTTAIAGGVSANVYDALADQADYLAAQGSLKPAIEKLKRNRDFNAKLRLLVSAGDWEGYDAHIKNYFEEREEAESVSEVV